MYAETRSNNQGVMKLLAGDLKPHPMQRDGPSKVVHSTLVSALLDGGQRNGMVCLQQAVDTAIKIADTTGSGVAVVGISQYSSASGALGYWSRRAAQRGYICLVMSVCPEMVAPHGSSEAIFGTNPISIGFPMETHGGCRPLVLDMATSSCAWYEVVRAHALGNTLPAPLGLNPLGQPTSNPSEILSGGALRSFDLSYKGSHLGLFVELLAGAWTGAAVEDKWKAQNWGSVVILLHPDLLLPPLNTTDGGSNKSVLEARRRLLQDRVIALCDRVLGARPLTGTTGPTLPGCAGDERERVALRQGEIIMDRRLLAALERQRQH